MFARPSKRHTLARFLERIEKHGLRLALPTRMLVAADDVFINGESHRPPAASRSLFAMLADARCLVSPVRTDALSGRLLYDWYRAGYIELGAEPADRSPTPS